MAKKANTPVAKKAEELDHGVYFSVERPIVSGENDIEDPVSLTDFGPKLVAYARSYSVRDQPTYFGWKKAVPKCVAKFGGLEEFMIGLPKIAPFLIGAKSVSIDGDPTTALLFRVNHPQLGKGWLSVAVDND